MRRIGIPRAFEKARVVAAVAAGCSAIACATAFAGMSNGAVRWTLGDIGTLPGHRYDFVQPVALNDHGSVVAAVTWGVGTDKPRQTAFVWRNGKRTQLGDGKSPWLDVVAINDRGDVAGDAGERHTVATLWRNGKATRLGTLGGADSESVAVNDLDQVVGTSRTTTSYRHAFIWQEGTMTDLGTLGGDDAFPTAINERGQVIGESTTADGAEHAFLWQNGIMTDLGSVDGRNSIARAINDHGVIVGDLDTPDGEGFPVEAVVWKDGRLSELGSFGAPGARGLAVNGRGDILVELDDKGGDSVGGRLLREGQQSRIPGLGGSPPPNQGGPLVLTGLNNRGQVAGYGYTKRGAGRRSFIWENGAIHVLPTRDGVRPPWGATVALSNTGELIGTTWLTVRGAGGNTQHGVVWRPAGGG
jgi:probable HAF family extracellular repeat protein